MPGSISNFEASSVTAASRSLSAFLPEPSSVLAWPAPVAGAVVVALTAAVPAAEPCAEVAPARSEVELVAAELAHSGWALADCWAGPPANDLAPAVALAELWAVDSARAYSAQAGSVRLRRLRLCCGRPVRPACSARAYLVALMEHLSGPADYSAQADRSAQRCSRDARPVYWPVAELRHDSPERYKASPLVSRARRRGR